MMFFSVVLQQLVCYDKEKQQLGLFRTIFETLSLYCFNKSKIILKVCSYRNMAV